MSRKNMNQHCTCTSGVDRHPETVDPTRFVAEDFCANHFDPTRVPDAERKLDASVYRSRTVTVELACALYLVLADQGGRSLENVRTVLARFCAYHPGQPVSLITPLNLKEDLERVRGEAIRATKESKRKENTGDGAVEAYISVLRKCFGFLSSFIPDLTNPAMALSKPSRKQKGAREVYDRAQLQAIWRAAAAGHDHALFLLILDTIRMTAIRRRSVRHMNMEDINFLTGKTLVRGKGGRVYPVWLSHQLIDRLLKLFLTRSGQTQDDLPRLMEHWCRSDYDPMSGTGGTPAFLTKRGVRVTNRTMESLIEDVNTQLEPGILQERFILHSLRHTTLTDVNENFGEAAAAGFAGHRNNKTALAEATRDYVQTRDRTNIAIFNALFGVHHTVGLLECAA